MRFSYQGALICITVNLSFFTNTGFVLEKVKQKMELAL